MSPKPAKKPAPAPNPTASDKQRREFHTRLRKMLESVQRRMERLSNGDFELRVSRVEGHPVSAHRRSAFERVYLARVRR